MSQALARAAPVVDYPHQVHQGRPVKGSTPQAVLQEVPPVQLDLMVHQVVQEQKEQPEEPDQQDHRDQKDLTDQPGH
jgi:hypothetical protein